MCARLFVFVALLGGSGFVASAEATPFITTVAGTGTAGFSGDRGPATAAELKSPGGVAFLAGGGFLISDTSNGRVRKVNGNGTIHTVAGVGLPQGFAGDGGRATAASLARPTGVAPLPGGGFLIADVFNNRVRKVDANGVITTVAGTGNLGFGGDGGLATAADLFFPIGIAVLPDGGFLIADSSNNRVRKVDGNGVISTVAGSGVAGFSGDGGRAIAAQLDAPTSVAVMQGGGFLIADRPNERVRMVDANGNISTVAGTGVTGLAGDGGPAKQAELNFPLTVSTFGDRSFLIADTKNHRVRMVTSEGVIRTVAGEPPTSVHALQPALHAKVSDPVALSAFSDDSGYLLTASNEVKAVFFTNELQQAHDALAAHNNGHSGVTTSVIRELVELRGLHHTPGVPVSRDPGVRHAFQFITHAPGVLGRIVHEQKDLLSEIKQHLQTFGVHEFPVIRWRAGIALKILHHHFGNLHTFVIHHPG